MAAMHVMITRPSHTFAQSLHCSEVVPQMRLSLLPRSFVLDETDGRAARTFNQSSTLGAVLDMVTDRRVLAAGRC